MFSVFLYGIGTWRRDLDITSAQVSKNNNLWQRNGENEMNEIALLFCLICVVKIIYQLSKIIHWKKRRFKCNKF